MQIQHPTAIMIARSATAQDDVTGDGTSSSVLFVGELLKYAERYIAEVRALLCSGGKRALSSSSCVVVRHRRRSPPLSPAPALASQGVHPRVIADGFELAKVHAVAFLDKFKQSKSEPWNDREFLTSVARTALRTKLQAEVRGHARARGCCAALRAAAARAPSLARWLPHPPARRPRRCSARRWRTS